ncbi:MAG: phosphoribosylanthranilate isomerase [Muribaculaceae bacterium]|nr:phosphoribosylanthranilate isomerase [Muribaculaceae bacterium]
MKVKVCGMREAGNISRVAELGIDYMGFIFHKLSPRNCLGKISPELLSSLPSGVRPVAVTVDLGEEELSGISERYGFRIFQLHGTESPEVCAAMRNRGIKVIKALGITSEDDLRKAEEYSGCVDLFLFDTATSSHGGSGSKFNWKILEHYRLPEPFLLSGGIGPADAEAIRAFRHPFFAGIDLNSRFETFPGIKDPEAIRIFINNLV